MEEVLGRGRREGLEVSWEEEVALVVGGSTLEVAEVNGGEEMPHGGREAKG